MEALGQIFDLPLLATIALIFGITLFGAYLRANRRDECLRGFDRYHVTLERASGKTIWGMMELEATGLELRYRDSVQDANHVESSYLLYAMEYTDIQAIFRFVDDLSPEDRLRRQKDLDRYFHPGPLVRLKRSSQQIFSLARDSMTEVLGLIMGRLRKPAGQYIMDASETHFKRFSSDIVGSVGSTYDPLLERLIGQKIVVDLIQGNEAHEHVGILKNYSPEFIELLDVQYPQHQSVDLAGGGSASAKYLDVAVRDGVVHVTNRSTQPLLIQSIQAGDDEELLNVVVGGEESVELHPEEINAPVQLTVKVVRELDMIVPRRRCVVRHRAERYEPTVIPEIIFDIGVMLRGSSLDDAREARLRRRLEENPNSALLASNLGGVLLQKGNYAEAGKLLERAYAARYSLPDSGRRTQMLLHELRRRTAKAAGQASPFVEKSPAPTLTTYQPETSGTPNGPTPQPLIRPQ
jgi:hypothetical protein